MRLKEIIGAIILLILTGVISHEALGQEYRSRQNYWSVGGGLNAMNYVGDLDPGPSFISPALQFTRYNIGLEGLYRYNSRISFRAAISYGRIEGSDKESSSNSEQDRHRRVRNLSFRNDIFELKADVVVDMFENEGTFKGRPDYTPYAFAGLAVFHHNPVAKDPDGDWVELQPLGTEGQGNKGYPDKYSLVQVSIPFGVGFRYKLNDQWDLSFEIGWRKTFTDYLDDVGGDYADPTVLGDKAQQMADRSYEGFLNDEVNRKLVEKGLVGKGIGDWNGNQPGGKHVIGYGTEGDQRSKPGNDMYVVTGFHLTYILQPGINCPKFR